MSKLLKIFVLTLTVSLCMCPVVSAAPTVYVDGYQLDVNVDPVFDNGRILVPMRAIFEALGAQLYWDGPSQMVEATKGDTQIILLIGGPAYKNGLEIPLDAPARIMNGSTMVPLRFVSEALGAVPTWDKETQSVFISTGAVPDSPPAVVPDTLPPATDSPDAFVPNALPPVNDSPEAVVPDALPPVYDSPGAVVPDFLY